MGRTGNTEVEPSVLGDRLLKVMEQIEESRKIPGPVLAGGLDLLAEEVPLSFITFSSCRNEGIQCQ